MIIKNLTKGSREYTSNVYHVTGSYHSLKDVNTLIDVGRDPSIIPLVAEAKTGLGKRPLDQIILTHSHFDHAEMLPTVLNRWDVEVFAHPSNRITGCTPLTDHEIIQIGNNDCEIIFTPGHSEDSICILCIEEGYLFSGDSPVRIYSDDGEYPATYLEAFEYICSYDIRKIYPGHGDPIESQTMYILKDSLRNLRTSHLI